MIELDLVQRWRLFQLWYGRVTGKLAYKIRRHKFPRIYDGATGKQCNPALTDSVKEGDEMSEREMRAIYERSECPDCGGEIRWGPEGGMHQNVKCFGRDGVAGCGARFNMSLAPMTFPVCQRLEDKHYVDVSGRVLQPIKK